MATVQIQFLGVGSKADAPKSKTVNWKLEKGQGMALTEIKKGTTDTTPDGVLVITDVDLSDAPTLRFTIGGQTGFVNIEETEETKKAQPFVRSYYLSLRLEVKIQDTGKEKAPVKDTPLHWELSRPGVGLGAKPIVQSADDNTDKDGKFVCDFEIAENETRPLKIKIKDQKGAVQEGTIQLKHNDETKKGNPLVAEKGFKLTSVQSAAIVSTVRVDVKNEGRHWLAYESVFNRSKNRKPNKKFEMGLYVIERSDAVVWFRDDIDAVTLKNLTAVFFPDYDPEKHLEQSNSFWTWKDDAGQLKTASTPTVVSHVSSGAQIKINLDSYVVLPYNFYDNDDKSRALGTKKLNDKSKQLKEDLKWDFWKSASRSCVVRLKRIKKIDDKWTDVFSKNTEWVWNYNLGVLERGTFVKDARGSYVKEVNYLLDKPLDPAGYKLSEFSNAEDGMDVSLKTGVMYVGSEPQSGSGSKDYLDENWIVACLRSDYVATYNKAVGKKFDEPDLMILTELVSITEKSSRVAGEKKTKLKDGIQVRDLLPLDKTKIYLAPLNIPYVDTDLLKFHDDFACLQKEEWRKFWKKHWAASLGKAKALFLLRYGLQHINPNPQNYLIEFESDVPNPKPTGRIVIRDLQDAALHREIIWAIHGPEGEPPPDEMIKMEDVKDLASKLKLEVLKYEFGKNASSGELNVKGYQETGTTDAQFGPSGTQFLWQRFSAFTNGTKVIGSKDEEPIKSKWKELLATMIDWGKAHNRAYVGCVEQQLGINFTEIRWDKISDPAVYSNLTEIGEAANQGVADIRWEEEAAKVIHNYLKSPEGQKAVRDYKTRKWEPCVPKFRLQVLDAGDKPIENALVRIFFRKKIDNKTMIGLTDGNGEIQIYRDLPEEYTVRMEDDPSGTFEVKDIKELTKSTLDLTNQGSVKIKYLA